jgi:transcriptional regulator with XRE-family HTH domain
MREVGFKSVKALSVQTEIGVTTLHNFSIGKANLPIEKLCKLLFALNCTFDELIEYTIIDNSDDSDLYEASLEEESSAIIINDAETKRAFQEFLAYRKQQKAS